MLRHLSTIFCFNSGVFLSLFANNHSCSATSNVNDYEFTQRLTGLVPENGDEFGFATAVDGDQLIIGDRADDAGGSNSGSAVIYQRSISGEWNRVTELIADDALPSANFGFSVAIQGSLAAVGAYRDNERGNESGAVYMYEKNAGGDWNFSQKIHSADIGRGDFFGVSLALADDSLFVGAFNDDDSANDSGAVYIFNHIEDSWVQTAKIKADTPIVEDFFGQFVAVDGDVAVVSSISGNAAWVLERSGSDNWIQTAKFTGVHNFGSSVDVYDGTIVVGERSAYGVQRHTGVFHVFETNSSEEWIKTDTLFSNDSSSDDRFGDSISLNGNRLVVGAPRNDDFGTSSGAAYLFERGSSGWDQVSSIPASVPSSREQFGSSVSLSETTIVVGARLGRIGDAFPGYVDVYGLVIPDPLLRALVDIKPGGRPNSVNLKSKGVLPVAILSTDEFDVNDVDIDSLLFGDPLLLDNGGTAVSPLRSAYEDVSGDGLLDLTLKFSTADLVEYEALGSDTIEGLLTGELLDGTPFEGTDSIRIVPPTNPGGRPLQLASVPEPSTLLFGAMASVGLLLRRRG